MWRVLYGVDVIYDPRDPDLALTGMEGEVTLNECGTFKFTMPRKHPFAGRIDVLQKDLEITVEQDGDAVFCGRAMRPTEDFFGNVEYECEGERAYLNDATLPPYSTAGKEGMAKAPSQVDALFAWYVAQYNAKASPRHRFIVGVNEGAALDPNNYLLRESSERPAVWAEIKDKLIDKLGGWVRVRHEGALRYIDYLADGGKACAQRIEFGENLIDFTRTRSATDYCTRIVPIGAKVKDADGNDTEEDVTIASLPDGPLQAGYEKVGDSIVSISGVAKYGSIEKTVKFEASTPAYLLQAGLRNLVNRRMGDSLEIAAVDLHQINPGIERIGLGDYIRATSKPNGLDEYFLCYTLPFYPGDPGKATYKLGSTYDTLTGRQSSRIAALNGSINKVYESVAPLPRAVKEAAKKADGAAQDAADATAKADGALTAAGQAAEQAQSAEGKAQEAIDKLADLHGTYVHVKWSDSPDGSGMGDAPGAYMGICSNESPDAPADPAAYAWAKVRGEDGQRGEDGEDGTPSYLHVKWADDAHGAGMRETPGPYMGTCVDSAEVDPTDPGRYAWALVKGADGQQGDPGKPGDKGDPGRGIASTSVSYQAGTSGTAAPAGAWTPTVPVVAPDRYLWTRTVTAYTSGPSTTAYSVGKMGAQGPKGDDGEPGGKGDKGADGKTLYGACNTAAATAAKVPASAIAGFSLYNGVCVSVKFTYANTSSAPTLNVNGTGAKPIKLNGANSAYWQAGATVALVYDGAAWQVCNTPLYGATSIIGNPAGGNVRTDGDGVSVRQGTTVLARLKAGLLELAADSADAVIKLCGGKGTMAYYAGTDQMAVMAPGSIAITTSYVDDAGHVMPSDAGIACNKTGVLAKGRVEVSGSLAVNSGGVYGETLLFADPAHPLNASAPLSQPAARFRRLKIGFRTNDGHIGYAETAGDKPDGQVVDLTCNVTNGMNMYIKSKSVLVRGSTISTYYAGGKYWTGEWGSDTGYVFADVVGIIQVVGVR